MQRDGVYGREVLYITNTSDSSAVKYVTHELGVCRQCEVVVTNFDEWLECYTSHRNIFAVLLDDVNPSTVSGVRDVLTILLRQRPLPFIVVLVGAEDYEHLGDIAAVIGDHHVVIHTHDQHMESCLDLLVQGLHGEQVS